MLQLRMENTAGIPEQLEQVSRIHQAHGQPTHDEVSLLMICSCNCHCTRQ